MTKSHYTAWLSFIMMESVFDCPLECDPLGWGLHQALGRCPTWYRGSFLQAVSGGANLFLCGGGWLGHVHCEAMGGGREGAPPFPYQECEGAWAYRCMC